MVATRGFLMKSILEYEGRLPVSARNVGKSASLDIGGKNFGHKEIYI